MLEEKMRIPKEKATYGLLDVDEMSSLSEYPLEVVISLGKSKKKKIMFHCGKIYHMRKKWCTTKFDKKG